MRNIPFSPPDITQKEIDAVTEVLKSGWITTGPKTKEFEKRIAGWCGTDTAVCLSSQTACAELTLRILGVGPGDEVIVPAYTYTASASVIYHVGATPIIIDCKEGSYEMDYAKVERAITERTKVIIPVDLAGVMCDYEKIFDIVNRKKDIFVPGSQMQDAYGRIIVMADAAHAFGAMQNGIPCGGMADFTNFSFHAVKNLTTAEGGAVTWKNHKGVDNDAVYKEYMLLSLHGQTKDAFAKNQGTSWEYDVVDTQYKCNMPDIMGAMGLAQLDRYPQILEKRHRLIEMYNKAFADMNIQVLTHSNERSRSSGHLYFVRFIGKTAEYRNRFYLKMAERGVICNVHFKPLPMLTAYKTRGFDITDYPNAYNMHKNQLTLPMNSKMTFDDALYVIETFKAVYAEMEDTI